MGVVKQFGLFLGWLSGTLIGITGLFYAIGFIATIANLSFLGLDLFLIDYDPFIYLARGANTLIFMSLEIGDLLIVLSPFIVLYPVFRRGLRKLSQALDSSSSEWRIQLGQRLKPYVPPAAYVLLFAYVYVILHAYITKFRLIFGVTNVLHNPDPIAGAATDSLKYALLCGDADALRGPFIVLAIATIVAALVTLLAYRTTAAMRSRQLLMIPFLGVLVMFVFLLPAVYGVMFLQRELAPVTLVMSELGQSKDYYLISRSAQRFMLWDPIRFETVVLQEKSVSVATIGSRESLKGIHPALQHACGGEKRRDEPQDQ